MQARSDPTPITGTNSCPISSWNETEQPQAQQAPCHTAQPEGLKPASETDGSCLHITGTAKAAQKKGCPSFWRGASPTASWWTAATTSGWCWGTSWEPSCRIRGRWELVRSLLSTGIRPGPFCCLAFRCEAIGLSTTFLIHSGNKIKLLPDSITHPFPFMGKQGAQKDQPVLSQPAAHSSTSLCCLLTPIIQ